MNRLSLFLCSLFFAFTLSGDSVLWNGKNSFKGWNGVAAAKKRIVKGILELSSIKRDCRIINRNVNIDPRKYNTLVFTYRATGGVKKKGELYFSHAGEKFNDSRRWDIPALNADGKWHTVKIRPADLSLWLKGGNIKALRFDSTNSAGGTIEIKEIRLEYTPPENPPTAKIDGPEWPAIKPELWKLETAAKMPQHYFKGKMIRSPEDKRSGKKYHTFFMRKSFFLKEKPVYAFLQYTADDSVKIFINGHVAGSSNNWRNTVTGDILKFLSSGKNVLAFTYTNKDTFGGVLAELYLKYADGKTERINTDKTFKCSVHTAENWTLPEFNDSNWQAAVEQAPPPAPPWRIFLPYKYFQNMLAISSVKITPAKVPAGNEVSAIISGKGPIPSGTFSGTVEFRQNGTSLFSEPISISQKSFSVEKNGRWTLNIAVKTPAYLKPGKFNIVIDSDVFSVHPETWPQLAFETSFVKNDPAYPTKNICKVVKRNGETQIELNGKPFYAAWLAVPWNFQYIPLPVNVVTVGANHSALWPGVDKFNAAALDMAAEKMRRQFPNAYFIWNISLVVPEDWSEKFPAEMVLNQKGEHISYVHPPHSYSSPTVKRHFAQIIKKTINHLENSPYANRIIGYRFSGGYTGEFLGWEPKGSALDFSDCGKAAYAKFVKENYPGLSTKVPSRQERLRKNNDILWDQNKNLRAIAYQQFTSRQLIDLLLPLCRQIRHLIGREKLLGLYYGYTSTLHHAGNSQYRAYYDLKHLLDSKLVDFLMSPNSYVLRNLGEFCGEMKPFRTLQNNNIIPVCEDDTRTHNGYYAKNKGCSTQTKTEQHTIAVLRRNMGIGICRTSPGYYFPLVGGTTLSFPAMKKEIAVLRTVGQHCLDVKAARNAQTALVVSEETIKTMPNLGGFTTPSGIIDQYYRADGTVQKVPRNKCVINFETFVGSQDRFTRSGAPIDQLLAEDLADHPGNYKLYVFLNCYKYDDKFLAAIKKLQQKKCVLLWLYAPGFWKGLSGNIANMKSLTGLDFEVLTNTSAAVKLKDGRIMGTPAAKINPLFAVKNKNAQIMGTYPNGKTGIAAVKTGKALTIYSGAWQLDTLFIRKILDKAGVFRYIDSDDPLDANNRLIVLHARRNGKKMVKLPVKTDVLDIFAQKIIARKRNHFESDFNLHETKLFYCGDDAESLLTKLKSTLNKQ